MQHLRNARDFLTPSRAISEAGNNLITTFQAFNCYAAPHAMWALSSLIRDSTCASCTGCSLKSLDRQGVQGFVFEEERWRHFEGLLTTPRCYSLLFRGWKQTFRYYQPAEPLQGYTVSKGRAGDEPRSGWFQNLCSFHYSTMPASMGSHLINIKLEDRTKRVGGTSTEKSKGKFRKLPRTRVPTYTWFP